MDGVETHKHGPKKKQKKCPCEKTTEPKDCIHLRNEESNPPTERGYQGSKHRICDEFGKSRKSRMPAELRLAEVIQS